MTRSVPVAWSHARGRRSRSRYGHAYSVSGSSVHRAAERTWSSCTSATVGSSWRAATSAAGSASPTGTSTNPVPVTGSPAVTPSADRVAVR